MPWIMLFRRHLSHELLLLRLDSQHHRGRILLLRRGRKLLLATFLVELVTLGHEESATLRTHFFSSHLRFSDRTVLLHNSLVHITTNAKGSLTDCLVR